MGEIISDLHNNLAHQIWQELYGYSMLKNYHKQDSEELVKQREKIINMVRTIGGLKGLEEGFQEIRQMGTSIELSKATKTDLLTWLPSELQ